MKMPSRLVCWTLGFACLFAVCALPVLAAEEPAPADAPAVIAELLLTPAPASTVGTPEAQPMGEPLGNCRVRCGFEFYWYGGMTESQCCNETQYCPDGSEGYAVAFQPYGGQSARCAP